MLGPGWIGQGAENIEHSAHADFPTRTDGVPHRAVQGRGKQKAHAHLADRRLHPSRLQANIDAQGFQQIGAATHARGRPIAVLGHHHPRASRHKRRRGRDIKGVRAIATGAGGIDWDCSCRRADKRCLVPHHTGTARNLFDRLTLHAQADDKRRDLGGRSTPFHDLPHHRDGFGFGEIAPLNDCLNTFSDHHLIPRPERALSRQPSALVLLPSIGM